MVEGLRQGRPLVKFRRVLPVAALLFVTITTYRYYHTEPFELASPLGPVRMARPGTRPSIVAAAINLPAGILALPLELAFLRNSQRRLRSFEAFRVVEFSVLGIVFWFFAGRFLDDLIAWRWLRSGSRWRLSDCLMAAVIAVEATLVLGVFLLEPRYSPDVWFLASGLAWALLGYWALIFRIVQFRSYPRIAQRNGAEPAGKSEIAGS